MKGPRRRAGLVALGALLGLASCASSNDVDGVWHAVAPAHKDGNLLLYDEQAQGVELGVELVIGQFGPDVGGIVRYHRSGTFERPRAAEAPDRQCACTFLRDGKVATDFDRLTFTLKGCVPGSATTSTLRLRGRFTLQDDGRLIGRLEVDEPSSPLHRQSLPLAFERVVAPGETEAADLVCTPPPADGNVSSGL